jgi:hypothetical protein
VCVGDHHLYVASQEWLAARDAELHRAQLASLAQHPQPVSVESSGPERA